MRRVGFTVLICGALLRIWAMQVLGKLFTFRLAVRKDHKVVQSGPFAFVRFVISCFLGYQIYLRIHNIQASFIYRCTSHSFWRVSTLAFWTPGAAIPRHWLVDLPNYRPYFACTHHAFFYCTGFANQERRKDALPCFW